MPMPMPLPTTPSAFLTTTAMEAPGPPDDRLPEKLAGAWNAVKDDPKVTKTVTSRELDTQAIGTPSVS
jgi:hypothetical protein